MNIKDFIPKIIFTKKELPEYKGKQDRMDPFYKLNRADKIAMKKFASTTEAFIFTDNYLPGMVARIMKNLATTTEGITNEGIAQAERMRGQLSMITELVKFFEQARNFKIKKNSSG